MTDDNPRTYTVTQLADILQVSPATIRAHVTKGVWPALKLGPRTLRFTPDHYQQILERTEHQPPQPRQRRTRRPQQ